MLPGLDGISVEGVLAKLSLLKYRNARGSHIYIRPSGEHRYTVLDDLNETLLAKLSADGFDPCAVVETSAGEFPAWRKTFDGTTEVGWKSCCATPGATLRRRSERRRLAAIRPAARLHQLQTQVPQTGWPLPFRSAHQPYRAAVPDGRCFS